MITCQQLQQAFVHHDFTFFTGVPDSTFKDWLLFLEQADTGLDHILANSETSAIALAAGYHLATNKIPVVYFQNSGLGNTVNPITSLADPEVYSIPMVLFIGWRGQPGHKDEPQHKKMGRITHELLDTLEIPHQLLPDQPEKLNDFWGEVKSQCQQRQAPYGVIIRKDIFENYQATNTRDSDWPLQREQAIQIIVDHLQGNEAIVCTTGKPSRELFEYRAQRQQGHQNDFYTVGSLGCATAIAAGIAWAHPQKKVFTFDADGSALMHTGSWSTVGHYQLTNLKHIIFDNEAHESTGGQPSNSQSVNFAQIALACGYNSAQTVQNQEQLLQYLPSFLQQNGPAMLVIKVKKSSRPNLGRPTTTPLQNKNAFMGTFQD